MIQSALFISLLLRYCNLLKIKTMKKLINLDRLACCRHCACFISVDSLSAQTDPTLDSICTICKSFSRISCFIKDKQLIKIERLAHCRIGGCVYFVFVCLC